MEGLLTRGEETDLETAVNQGFIEIKYKTFPTCMERGYGGKEGFWKTVL
jgi:hypothetical protein